MGLLHIITWLTALRQRDNPGLWGGACLTAPPTAPSGSGTPRRGLAPRLVPKRFGLARSGRASLGEFVTAAEMFDQKLGQCTIVRLLSSQVTFT